MMPIVPMKSSTGIPFRAWMFLKAFSEVNGLCCDAVWPPADPTPISHPTVIPAIARIIPCSLMLCCGAPFLLTFAEYGDKTWGRLQHTARLQPAYHRFLRASQAGLKSRAG